MCKMSLYTEEQLRVAPGRHVAITFDLDVRPYARFGGPFSAGLHAFNHVTGPTSERENLDQVTVQFQPQSIVRRNPPHHYLTLPDSVDFEYKMVRTTPRTPEDVTLIAALDKAHTKGRRDRKVRHCERPSFGDLRSGFVD